MKKVKNKKAIILSIIIILVILLTILFMFLFRKTDVKKLKGTVTEIPVNSAFTDIGFYSCVLNSYNKENGTNYTRDYNLSDEQLASIKNLSCYDFNTINTIEGGTLEKLSENSIDFFEIRTKFGFDYSNKNYFIEDLNGLDKLTGITSISMHFYPSGNKVIDLSNNTSLTSITLATNLNINGLKNLTNLKKLRVYGFNYSNTFEEIGNLSNLEELKLYNTKFNDLAIIKNLNNLKKLAIRTDSNITMKEETKLSDLPYLKNLTYLDWGESEEETGELPLMPNLNTLDISGYNSFGKLDFSKFPNLTNLIARSVSGSCSKIENGVEIKVSCNNLNDLNNLTTLSNLEYFEFDTRTRYYPYTNHYTYISDLTGIEKLLKLKTLVIANRTYFYEYKLPDVNLNIERLYGEVDDYSKLPNLKEWYIDNLTGYNEYTNRYSQEELNVISNLEGLYVRGDIKEEFMDFDISFPKLKNLYVGGSDEKFPSEIILKMPNLETLFIDNWQGMSNYLDLNNNKKLKTLYCSIGDGSYPCYMKNYENLTDLEVLSFVADYDKTLNNSKDPINLSNLKNLKLLNMQTLSESIIFSPNSNIEFLYLSGDLSKLDISNLNNLELIGVFSYAPITLDLSNCNELYHVQYGYENSSIVGFKGDNYLEYLPLKLPNHYKVIDVQSEKNLVSMDENGILKINEVGSDSVMITYRNMLPVPSNLSDDITLNNQLTAFDLIFKDDRYIKNSDYLFTGTDRSEKKIISNIKQKGAFLSAAVDNKQLKIMQSQISNEPLRTYKLINIHSNDYDITDDTIFYNGDFDVNKVHVSNAEVNVVDDKLDIIYNNDVIKSYNLVKKNNILGDVNGDGIVSISDMSLQYKHVKYILDLIGNQNYRADLNNDDDVSITDVTQLYKFIKGITTLTN